ncbi:leucine-rich repeat neuronal protein 2 [Linepithema humile]|uniref:leucine-rich repeat neuronal protein 2 n=1 Tax=Linepithema humile TaxID=83485 RepID=UPI00062328A3|nr:PREDICTED: leucine-rich repeat neuronal protein 2 [Linepithema humile]
MDFRVSVFLLAIFFLVKCENTVNITVSDSNAIKTEISVTTPASLCTVCTCTDVFVNCSSRNLKNHFTNIQWPNTTIKEILFEHNDLVHVTSFPKIIVEKLILRNNKISVIDYHAFKELVNLTELDLSHNQLTSERLQPHVFEGKFSPVAYEPLSNLRVLNLAGNILHWLHQSVFEHLVGIKVLNLSGNPFGVIDYRTSIAISSLSYLEELDISYCGLKDLPNFQFHNSKYLKRLDLTNNELTVLPRALEDAKALEYLRLDANPIRVIDRTNACPNLTNLKELSLREMPSLTEIGNGGLSALTGLENLYVQNCEKLEKIDEYAIASKTAEGTIWPPLKILNLESNALQYLPMLLVGRWDNLEELHLKHNQWSCDCRNQYLIGTVLQQNGKKLMGAEVSELTCSAPPELAEEELISLTDRHLRCLDLYDARPEKDAAILVGVLIGLLLAIPVGMALFAFWRRGFIFCGSQGPATFSRAFYKRASNDDEI